MPINFCYTLLLWATLPVQSYITGLKCALNFRTYNTLLEQDSSLKLFRLNQIDTSQHFKFRFNKARVTWRPEQQ